MDDIHIPKQLGALNIDAPFHHTPHSHPHLSSICSQGEIRHSQSYHWIVLIENVLQGAVLRLETPLQGIKNIQGGSSVFVCYFP